MMRRYFTVALLATKANLRHEGVLLQYAVNEVFGGYFTDRD